MEDSEREIFSEGANRIFDSVSITAVKMPFSPLGRLNEVAL